MNQIKNGELQIHYIPLTDLKPVPYNPRTFTKEQLEQIKESITRFNLVDPLIVNSAQKRKNFLIGGNLRLRALKELGYTTVPIVYINIPDEKKEQELNVRLSKNQGSWNLKLLAQFDESFLSEVGFNSIELDDIFPSEEHPETFDIKKELSKLNITNISVQKGDIYKIGSHRLMCGDSTIETDILKLMHGEKADMCFTDEPYVLDYLHGKKRKGKATKGFGYKRDRQYLETDNIPDDFVAKWMANIAKVQKDNFSIIAFEHPKNLKLLWTEMEKYWKYRGTIIWNVPNRVQGFAGKYKFFNKFDVALVGSRGAVKLNKDPEEDELLQNEYEAAIFATSGSPSWEAYKKGGKYCPTDHITHIASDAKHSGQSVVFGTKPIEIILPYIKVLTKRNDLIIEPFGGSGSTLIAAEKLHRRCYLMEKVPTYMEVIKKRIETLMGIQAEKIN